MIWLKRISYGMIALANITFAYNRLSSTSNDIVTWVAICSTILGSLLFAVYLILCLVYRIRSKKAGDSTREPFGKQ